MNRKPVVAFCSDAPVFSNNQILDPDVAKRYPGASWLVQLASILRDLEIRIVTGDIALQEIDSQILLPSNILVIQDDISLTASKLLSRGAKGWVCVCLESPLFAADFYQLLPRLSKSYDHCILFGGAIDCASPRIRSHVLHFPSYHRTYTSERTSWDSRRHMVMVAGNKYWHIKRSRLRQVVAYIRDWILRRPKRFSRLHASLQLHDHRLSAISYFGTKGQLDLYGNNWDDLKNLPFHWQVEIQDAMHNLSPSPVLDKHKLLGNYKFSLCLENITYPGYVTEKIFDCIANSVVPIYIGAPDIHNFVPEGCFVDARNYSLPELELYLNAMTESDWENILEKGQSFLLGPAADRHSYEGFAEYVADLLSL